MKQLRRALVAICTVVLVFAIMSPTVTSAGFYNTGKTITRKEGGLLGSGIFGTTYTYEIWKSDAWWYVMFPLDVCIAIHHSKNTGDKSLTYSVAQTYTTESAFTFSTNTGGTIDSGLVTMTIEQGFSQTYTTGLQVAASGSVGSVIPSNSDSGWYKMSICYNFDRLRYDKYEGNTYLGSSNGNLPEGDSFVATLYNPTANTHFGFQIWGL